MSGLFGLLVGSFLNALIYRLPREINIAFPRSSCPSCKKLIFWYENIPVLSYLFLRGKCSGCGSKISIEYPIVEIIAAIAALMMAPENFEPQVIFSSIFYFTVFCSFLVHFIVDLKHQILPDAINLYLGILFLVVSFINYGYLHWVLGLAIGFGFPYLISYVFYKLKGQIGLGGGDIKLWGVLGLYLGPMGIIQNIFISCAFGALIGGLLLILKIIKRETPIPFGPFIIIIAFVQIFFQAWFKGIMQYIS
jgi:leader peptidase (prepilin peptidase)/N-methyltransferase